MKLKTITEGTLDTIGHTALDIAGLIPGVGESADLTNALWYAKKGQYLNSALSIISMIPEIGDAIGKGTKYLGKSSNTIAKFIEKYGPIIAKYWPKIIRGIEKSREWRPFVDKLDKAVNDLLSNRSGDRQVSQQYQ